MPEKVMPGPVQDTACIREGRVHTHEEDLMILAKTRIVSRICAFTPPRTARR